MKTKLVAALFTATFLLNSSVAMASPRYVMEKRKVTGGERYCKLLTNTVGIGNLALYKACMTPASGTGWAFDKMSGKRVDEKAKPLFEKKKPSKAKPKKGKSKKPFIQWKWKL